jgi:hypothetical protein
LAPPRQVDVTVPIQGQPSDTSSATPLWVNDHVGPGVYYDELGYGGQKGPVYSPGSGQVILGDSWMADRPNAASHAVPLALSAGNCTGQDWVVAVEHFATYAVLNGHIIATVLWSDSAGGCWKLPILVGIWSYVEADCLSIDKVGDGFIRPSYGVGINQVRAITHLDNNDAG